MAKLATNIKKIVKKTDVAQIAHRKIVGEEKYDKIYDKAHFLTTPMIEARQQKKDAEAALANVKEEKVMPLSDEESLTRSRRKALSRRQALSRSSTILGGGSESLG